MLFKLKHTIIIVGCFFYTWTFLIGQNILSNGDFEQITSVWNTKFGCKYVKKSVSKNDWNWNWRTTWNSSYKWSATNH